MRSTIELLAEQQYQPIKHWDTGYFLDTTIYAYELAAKIMEDRTYNVDTALSQQNKFSITPLQFLSEQRLYQLSKYCWHLYVITNPGGSTYRPVATGEEETKKYTNLKHTFLKPVFTALIAPFENEDKNQKFTDLLLIQNSAGQTPLHSLYVHYSKSEPFVPIYERIKKLTQQQKISIATKKNQKLQNIFHVMAEYNWSPLEDTFNVFGAEATLHALTAQDLQGKTPLHYAFRAENQAQVAVTGSYAKLFLECENSPLSAKQAIKTQDFTGKNILHYALSGSDDKIAKQLVEVALQFVKKPDAKSVETDQKELTSSQKELFYSAITATDYQKLSPFHLACQKGYDILIDLIFKNLDIEQRQELILQKHNKYTALHLACQSGSASTVDKILSALESKTVYDIYQADKNILHQLVKANPKINLELFEGKINEKINWFLIRDCVKKRSKQSSFFHLPKDLKDREKDFINLLSSKGVLSSDNDGFSHGKYIRVRAQLKPDPAQQEAVIADIKKNKETDPEDYKLASALDSSQVLYEMLGYLQKRQEVKPGLLSYKYSDYEKRIEDFIDCLKKILAGEELSNSALGGLNYNRLRGGLPFVTREQVKVFIQSVSELNKQKDQSTDVLARLSDAFPLEPSSPKNGLRSLQIAS